MQNEYLLLVRRSPNEKYRNPSSITWTFKRRVLNPSILGIIWGTTIDSESNAFLDEVVVRIRSYLEGKANVNDFIPQSSLRKTSDLSLPLEGLGLENALADIDYFLKHSVKTNQPGFMNPLWGGVNIAAFAGEVIATLANNSMYTYELSPMATLIEQALIKRMCEMVGFTDGNGTLTSGGSNSNMIGMLCARYIADPLGQQRGFDSGKLVSFVSEESHYSVLMAANVLGIGFDNVVKVPCDSDGRMRVDKLEEEISRSRVNGQIPFCVVATSGTTVRGAFDPLREIAEICSNQNIWLHVDAAWGGSCLFSNKLRVLMDGVELADSVCWDPHKMMGVPLVCSAFLIKKPEILRKICSHGNVAHYLFLGDAEDVDLGRTSLQCGRRNDALKLFLSWREKGDAGWARLVENYIALADYLQTRVENHPNLEMMSTRQWSNVCIRYTAESIDHDEINSTLRDRLVKSGNFMISQSNIRENTILRPVIANPSVCKETIDDLVDEITRIGEDIVRGIPFSN
ncbi:MAG: aminotransferase class V-fold PLP-dependent enzyme [Candidatus Thermoplasmatota archaeon]|nr:aminotransferase class V-fold PLP-dependent enzyme [Candidatus Thermoplasmatota archaeon]MEC8789572.1 aminotransferase class V-fold PLP-dependent enzyme [Candidatus Thermoplasmatota archaeon]|tara:strand:+ start:346 stop:1887 length:1542 start_codon:yes stop_codon:yes gene_type:complete